MGINLLRYFNTKTKAIISKRMKSKKIMRLKIKILLLQMLSLLMLAILITNVVTVVQGYRYDIKEYNCVQMSEEWKAIFEKIGLETKVVIGVKPGEINEDGKIKAHQWLMVNVPILGWREFEATAITFTKVSNEWAIYKIDDKIEEAFFRKV